MQFSPILLLHIGAGVIALLSGAAAMSFRKGSHQHRRAGDVFVLSMICLGASGAYLGSMRHEAVNVAMGILTCYLVATAWMTARRTEADILEWSALVVPLAVGSAFVINGLKAAASQTAFKDGVPAAAYFMIGCLAVLLAAGDVRVLMRGGISGMQRLVRHLWRMCFALFIASGSLFLARPHLFPAILRKTNIIFLLGILPLILMIFWLIRVRVTNARKARVIGHGEHPPAHQNFSSEHAAHSTT